MCQKYRATFLTALFETKIFRCELPFHVFYRYSALRKLGILFINLHLRIGYTKRYELDQTTTLIDAERFTWLRV